MIINTILITLQAAEGEWVGAVCALYTWWATYIVCP